MTSKRTTTRSCPRTTTTLQKSWKKKDHILFSSQNHTAPARSSSSRLSTIIYNHGGILEDDGLDMHVVGQLLTVAVDGLYH
eukprot:scaffold14276_cov75-Attheya_sp.AAC.1